MPRPDIEKQPWLKFFPADWRAEPALRMCSIGARGLWMEMLCLMHEASPYGSLLVNGKPVAPRQLAALAALTLKDVEGLIQELDDAGVFSRDEDGTIYSRRMRRDAARSAQDKAYGSSGGNPSLKQKPNGGVNPPNNPDDGKDKAGVNPNGPENVERDKAGVNPNGPENVERDKPRARHHAHVQGIATQKPEARKKEYKPPPADSDPGAAAAARAKRFEPHDDGPADEFRAAQEACTAALGGSQACGGIAPADAHFGPMMLLVDRGFPLKSIVTVLRSFADRPPKTPVKTWSLWASKVAEQLAAAPQVEPAEPTYDIRGMMVPESRLAALVAKFWETGEWPNAMGLSPDFDASYVPPRLRQRPRPAESEAVH